MTEFITDEDTAVQHHNGELIILEIGDEEYALSREAAGNLHFHLGTTLGCLDGIDPDDVPRHDERKGYWWRDA